MKHFLRILFAFLVAHHPAIQSHVGAQASFARHNTPILLPFNPGFHSSESVTLSLRTTSLATMALPRPAAKRQADIERLVAIGVLVGGAVGAIHGASRPITRHCSLDIGYCAVDVSEAQRASNFVKGGLLGGVLGGFVGGMIAYAFNR